MSTLTGRTNSTVALWDPLACKTAWPVNRDCDGFNIFQGQSRTQNSKRRPVMLLISILDSCWLHHPYGLQHKTSSYMSHYVHTCWRVIKKIWWIDYNHRMTMQINAGCDLHICIMETLVKRMGSSRFCKTVCQCHIDNSINITANQLQCCIVNAVNGCKWCVWDLYTRACLAHSPCA